MYNIYPPPYGGYPPAYPPPANTPSAGDLEKGFRIAMKLRQKEERKEEKKKENEAKKKAEDRKKAEESRSKNFFGLEWYILGILSYPIIGPLYKLATHNLEVFSGGLK